MRYFYDYKEKNGAKVGGHNLETIEFYDGFIKLLGTEFNGEHWGVLLDMTKIEYLTIIPMEEEK